MTRAQIRIIAALQGVDFLLGKGSDGYPEDMIYALKDFSGNISALSDQLYLDVNPAANSCYYYEINCDTRTLTYWGAQTYWRNAPEDWEKRGWHCWMGKNGKYGWTEWRKGKKLGTHTYPCSYPVLLAMNVQYTMEDIKALAKSSKTLGWNIKRTLKKARDIHTMHTFFTADEDVYRYMYEIPYDEIPLKIVDPEYRWDISQEIFKWRLKIGK